MDVALGARGRSSLLLLVVVVVETHRKVSSSRISLGLSLDLIFQSKRKTGGFIKIIKLSEAISICLK